MTKVTYLFLETEICKNNEISVTKKREVEDTSIDTSSFSKYIYLPSVSQLSQSTLLEVQGTLGPNNTINFSREVYHFWPRHAQISPFGATVSVADAAGKTSKTCALMRADILIETVPLKVTVTVPGTASSISKTLRVVNTSFKYSEDPDNPIDDTARMTEYAQDLLQKYKDIKINGSITLDKIDLDWDLDKTVNLINTDQASWSSINAKVIGIRYNFDANTTTLEITSEYLK